MKPGNHKPIKKRIIFALFPMVCVVCLLCSLLPVEADMEVGIRDIQTYRLAKQMLEKGKQLFDRGDVAAASETLNQCLELFPRYCEADYYLSRIHSKTGHWNRALKHIEKARANAGFMTHMQEVLHAEYVTGLQREKEALERRLTDVTNQIETERIKQHISILEKWIKTPPDSPARLDEDYCSLHGTILLKLHRYAGAAEQFKQILKLNPKNGGAMLNLALSYFKLRQYQDTLDTLNRAESQLGLTHPQLKENARLAMDLSGDVFRLLRSLVEPSLENESPEDNIQTFMALFTKFYHRPELLSEEVLSSLYYNFRGYNVMVDFIEKIPIKNPAAVPELFKLAKRISAYSTRERELYTCVFQSLLELISQTARYAPDHFDYDPLIAGLTAIPLIRLHLYDNVFKFFDEELGVGRGKKSLIDFLLTGVDNRTLSINDVDYLFVIKDIFREDMKKILQTQSVCSFSTLLKINRLLNALSEDEAGPVALDVGREVVRLVGDLPFPEISDKAPKAIRDRVMNYSRVSLDRDMALFMRHLTQDPSGKNLKQIIKKIKEDYLLHQLNDYLLALAYAVNAKSPKLKVFINPNMVRLHDFKYYKDRTPWNYSGTPPDSGFFAGYHLCGGLSRLNVAFAAKWFDHLFAQTDIYNPLHLQAVLINLLDSYPLPRGSQNLTTKALLVDFGMTLLQKARDEKNETLKQDIISELGGFTTGYHYRKAVAYLTGTAERHGLYFSEMKQLGEAFLKKEKYLDQCPGKEQLAAFTRTRLTGTVEDKNEGSGNIYYRTFGNLSPKPLKTFPQDVSVIFRTGWPGGEMIDEFKIKLGWLFLRKKIPSFMLGQVLYSYLNDTIPRILSQNHPRDYSSTYFVFEVLNNSHLNRILKNLQKQGYLKLK